MPPQKPIHPADPSAGHEPQAFETDLERHRGSDDEVYGAHGVQPDTGDMPVPRGNGTRLTRVGQRRRH
ncbi:hypothetical protein [Ferrovibrio terrae]|uniref:hypothetical protein n=1 Tax=Ferrovibrio terrae TaxID=2594003 RepID=UPI00313777D1